MLTDDDLEGESSDTSDMRSIMSVVEEFGRRENSSTDVEVLALEFSPLVIKTHLWFRTFRLRNCLIGNMLSPMENLVISLLAKVSRRVRRTVSLSSRSDATAIPLHVARSADDLVYRRLDDELGKRLTHDSPDYHTARLIADSTAEHIEALFSGNNVILNSPSGNSILATIMRTLIAGVHHARHARRLVRHNISWFHIPVEELLLSPIVNGHLQTRIMFILPAPHLYKVVNPSSELVEQTRHVNIL